MTDLSEPFLVSHFTPSSDATPLVNIGRENYLGLEGIDHGITVANLTLLARKYLFNSGSFRRYVHEQAYLALPLLFLKAAKELIPAVRAKHIEISQKVGILSQLFNRSRQLLEGGFLCLPGPSSTHVLNANSPAFTACFDLEELILDG